MSKPVKIERKERKKEYTIARGGVVGVERSHDQTKMAERLNGRETSTNISFKTRTSIQE